MTSIHPDSDEWRSKRTVPFPKAEHIQSDTGQVNSGQGHSGELPTNLHAGQSGLLQPHGISYLRGITLKPEEAQAARIQSVSTGAGQSRMAAGRVMGSRESSPGETEGEDAASCHFLGVFHVIVPRVTRSVIC